MHLHKNLPNSCSCDLKWQLSSCFNNVSYKMIKIAYYAGLKMNKVTNIVWPSDWRVIHPTFSIMNTNIGVNSLP